jgi:hypothetical protein
MYLAKVNVGVGITVATLETGNVLWQRKGGQMIIPSFYVSQ